MDMKELQRLLYSVKDTLKWITEHECWEQLENGSSAKEMIEHIKDFEDTQGW